MSVLVAGKRKFLTALRFGHCCAAGWRAVSRPSLVVALAGALAETLTACERTSPERDARAGGAAAAPSGIRYLAADGTPEDGFAYATSPPELAFPEDHADHPEYRTEWWYFTGNLESESGGHYGFELTIFRFALAPEPPAGDSAWATNQIWMAHLAVTDARAGRMIAEERLTRGALGLAGAARDPVSVWVESWSITALPEPRHAFVVDAHGDRIGLQLRLEALKPPVTHGDDGLEPKGPEPGNASHYYSLTRIAAEGEVTDGWAGRCAETPADRYRDLRAGRKADGAREREEEGATRARGHRLACWPTPARGGG